MSHHPTLAEVDAFPVPPYLAPRIVENYGRSLKQAQEMIREAKRMLFLCVVSDEPVAPSDIVDEAWHEMMMFTKFYKQFSDFIGAFIHHDPTPPDEQEQLEFTESTVSGLLETSGYTKTKELYRKFFHEEPPRFYWP